MQAGTLVAQRYRVEEKLGEGGMGIVFRAHDTLLNRPVAIKALLPMLGEDGGRRLIREAQAAAQLAHPGIVGIHDVIEEDAAPLIVMELVDGRPLSELVPLDIFRTLDLAVQLARALQYAHSHGIVHRDIKPENIVVTDDGTTKVMDFGLARSEGRSRLTQTGLILGTVAYMAPEQILGGTVDGRADLYSLGCVLYEALTGRKPFEGEDAFTVLSQHVNVMPVAPRWHNPAVSVTLDAIVMRLLAKNPEDRYPSAEALLTALEGASEPAALDVAAGEATTRTALLERIVRGKLVGRTAELRELRDHLDRVLSGEGRLVLISGEPGIGKTRLAEELAIYAHLRGGTVARGHCYEQDVAVPYLPFVESLRQLYQGDGRLALAELSDHVADLARLLPELRETTQASVSLSPDDERARTFEAVTQWAAATARRRPLVFILDDLHWADRASLRLLHHLARALRGVRMLLLATYRDIELDLQHPLNDALAEMNRERLYYRLLLRRLSEEDTHALLSGLFDARVSTELAQAVYRETEGNPFFIEEVVKALVEEGRIYREGGRWQRLEIHELEIPQSVKAVVGRRLQKASEPCQRALTVAAVLGREFDPDVLMKVSGLEEDPVLDALDEAVRLQLIREARSGRTTVYAFEHALIRQTLYESLNARRRMRLHEQAGEALEALHANRINDHLEELAYHFGVAGLAAARKGFDYNLRAARKAAGLYALEEGERRIAVALELADALGDAGLQVTAYRALGDLYLTFEERRRASDAYERALQILHAGGADTSDDAVTLYLKFGEATAAFLSDVVPQAVTYARAAADALNDQPDQPRKARALSLLAMHEVRSGDLQTARQHAQEALDLATRLGDRDEQVKAYQAMASVHRSSNEWDRFREVVEQRRALLSGMLTFTDTDLYMDLIQSRLHVGQAQEAERLAREFLKLGEKLRSPTAMFRAYSWLASGLAAAGKWDEALEARERAVELGQRIRGVDFLLGWNLAYGAALLAYRGQEEQARARIAQVEALRYDLPPEHHSPRTITMDVARRLNDPALATRLMLRVEGEQPQCMTCRLIFHLSLGATKAWLGDIAGAETRLNEARRIIPEQPDPDFLIEAALLEAQIAAGRADPDAAARHAQDALPHIAGRPVDIFKALYQLGAADIFLRRRTAEDLVRARQLLTEALAFYQTAGARRLEEQANALLASL